MLYLVAAVLLLALSPLKAEEKWVRVRTENFEIYTPQSEKKAKETLLYFEQLREFFLYYWKTKADPGTPVRIVQFANEKQWESFRPHKNAAGFYVHGVDRDWIALSGYLQGWERLVCHEYTHLMVKQSGLNLPVWLNEGVAEIYSTFQPKGGKVQIGDLIPGHFYAVQQGWIPVPRLLEVKQDSPEYGGKDTAQFYAEAWGLTHMLMLGQEHKQENAQILGQILAGTPIDQALASVPKMNAKELDVMLRDYLKNNSRFFAGLIAFKSEKSQASWTAERVPQSEVDAVLAELQMNGPHEADAKARLSKVDLNTWQGQEAWAYGSWRAKDLKAASEHFEKAMALGADSAKLYFDAARASMYSGERSPKSIEYLKKAVALYPEWPEAKVQLLEQYVYLGRFTEAMAVTGEFKRVSPQLASRLFRGAAYAEAVVSGPETAKRTLARARQYAKSDYDQSECQRLETFLGQLETQKQAEGDRALAIAAQMQGIQKRADANDAAVYEPAEPDSGAPTLRRRVEGLEFTGTMTSLDCSLPRPLLTVLGEDGEKLQAEIVDPKQVNVQHTKPGEETKYLELPCGEQKTKVRIRYLKPKEGGGISELRSIEFL